MSAEQIVTQTPTAAACPISRPPSDPECRSFHIIRWERPTRDIETACVSESSCIMQFLVYGLDNKP
jgi:hypothetical protein